MIVCDIFTYRAIESRYSDYSKFNVFSLTAVTTSLLCEATVDESIVHGPIKFITQRWVYCTAYFNYANCSHFQSWELQWQLEFSRRFGYSGYCRYSSWLLFSLYHFQMVILGQNQGSKNVYFGSPFAGRARLCWLSSHSKSFVLFLKSFLILHDV